MISKTTLTEKDLETKIAESSGGSGPATEIIESDGPTTLSIESISDGQMLIRDGSTISGRNPAPTPIRVTGAPTTADWDYPVGTQWVTDAGLMSFLGRTSEDNGRWIGPFSFDDDDVVQIAGVGLISGEVIASVFHGYLDGTAVRAASIQSATSDITVNGAAEPIAGQVLTAMGPGSAQWQTPSSGPRSGVTPDLLNFVPNLGPVGSVWVGPGLTVPQSVGAAPGIPGTYYHGGATQTADAYGVKSDSLVFNLNSCGIQPFGTGFPITRRDRNPWFLTRFKFASTVDTCGWFAGLFKANLVDYTTYPDYCLTFSCSSAAEETTWQLGSRDGTATTKTDLEVSVTADHEYSMYFQVEGISSNDIRWVIYNHTTSTSYSGVITAQPNLPTLTDNLGPIISGVNVGAVSHTIYLYPTPFQIGQLGS